MPNDDLNEFKFVSHKRKGRNQNVAAAVERSHSLLATEVSTVDKQTSIRRIQEAKEEVIASDFYQSVKASLREGVQLLGGADIGEIVCFGLGKIGECMTARYQLALLLSLKDLHGNRVSAYDPVFSATEREILDHFGVSLIARNAEGKFRADRCTIFFLPHCPKQLSNNLLWANWGLNLSNCIIVANSFNRILEANTKRGLVENAGYVLRVSPYVTELAVINSFKFYDIFNDTAIHVFPRKTLALVDEDLWEDNEEPVYPREDIEFVTDKLRSLNARFTAIVRNENM